MKHDRRGCQPVPASAAHLLVVAVDRFRDAGVQDGPHVGLVDAEAEGASADDDVDVAHLGAEFRGEGFAAPLPDDPAALVRGGITCYHRDPHVPVSTQAVRHEAGVLSRLT